MHETRATKDVGKGRVILFSNRLHLWHLKKQLWNQLVMIQLSQSLAKRTNLLPSPLPDSL